MEITTKELMIALLDDLLASDCRLTKAERIAVSSARDALEREGSGNE